MNYKYFGAHFCCSSNGAMNVKSVKRFIDYLSKMGYNLLEIGLDDMFSVDNEPYYGYLRGGYSKEELKEIDKYARSKGIEVVPTIQILGHMNSLVRMPEYEPIIDINNILLIDEPRTYELIENIIKTLRECFSTNLLNIGFDEAHYVGLGKYLDKHGYHDKYELLIKHLNKGVEIAKKYNFNCQMWSDMFFRIKNNGNYYVKNFHVPKEVREKVPENVDLIYWDYYSDDFDLYDSMLKSHKEFNRNVWYAGAANTFCGFAPQLNLTLHNMEVAMKAVIKNNIENVLITLWGDDGNECSYFASIPTLFAIKKYSEGIFDLDVIKKEFFEMFEVKFDTLLTLDVINKHPLNKDLLRMDNSSKINFYNDLLLGIKDYALEKVGFIDYESHSKALKNAEKEAGEFSYLFKKLYTLSDVLFYKYDLGIKLRKFYQQNDKAKLAELLPVFDKIIEKIPVFYESFREEWMIEKKPHAFDVMDIRIGGVLQRIKACKKTLISYLEGKINSIEELEIKLEEFAKYCTGYNSAFGFMSIRSI